MDEQNCNIALSVATAFLEPAHVVTPQDVGIKCSKLTKKYVHNKSNYWCCIVALPGVGLNIYPGTPPQKNVSIQTDMFLVASLPKQSSPVRMPDEDLT